MRGGGSDGAMAALTSAKSAIDKAIGALEAGAGEVATAVETPVAAAVKTVEADVAQAGGRKSKKTSKSGKKRGLNSYMKFANSRRGALMKLNPGKKVCDIAKLIGAEWRNLSDSAKAAFA